MPKASKPGTIFSIEAQACFVDELALGLMRRLPGDGLLDALILLPTRRAARALREAFLRLNDGKPMLLPRMLPLGDVDEEELVLAGAELGGGAGAAIAPAIGELRRQAFLARLVGRWIKSQRAGDDGFAWSDASPAQAYQLAAELARLLDQLLIEQVPMAKLKDAVEIDMAGHWQLTLAFLEFLAEHWAPILKGEGAIEAAERRNLLLLAQAKSWAKSPPDFPVIAAGSTGSIPATRALLAAIAKLPRGLVILPGLDRGLDEAAWQAIDETHPQFGLRELLASLDCPRGQVGHWQRPAGGGGRQAILSLALAPAASGWAGAEIEADPLPGVARADCATPQHEAMAIALYLRQAAQIPGRSAALVTPDRNLARRVAAEMRRWGIEIDDSAGIDLGQTPPLVFANLILEAVDQHLAPVALLAVLKHPFARLGLKREAALAAARALDRDILRGPKPAPGIEGLRALVDAFNGKSKAMIADLLARIERAIAPLRVVGQSAPAGPWLDATLQAMENLAASDSKPGAAVLWRGEDGEAAAALLDELRQGAIDGEAIAAGDFPALFAEMCRGHVLRPKRPKHPRLAILGPLEARLLRFDCMALGGLNEGTWPAEVDSGPWLSRPMREKIGLPQPERRIGQAAHDFVQAFAAEDILLTRAERVDGTPTVPARWLVKLDALLKYDPTIPQTLPAYRQRGAAWSQWAEAIDRPEAIEARDPPAPVPPLAARPRQLSVTAVELWRRDPYALYAQRILGLRPLDPLEQEAGVAERGSIIHDVLYEFSRQFPGQLPADALAQLMRIGERKFADALQRPAERAFWWPRFAHMARWFVAQERARRAAGFATLLSEQAGAWSFKAPGGQFTLTAKADRIDKSAGGIEIIDYKTGRPPSKEEIEAGYAPQLPLEGVIAEQGGYEIKAKAPIASLAFWIVNGKGEGGEIAAVEDAALRIAQAREGLIKLVAKFDKQETPYLPRPQPQHINRFNDYEHLERFDEWSGKVPDKEGGQ